MLVPPQNLDAEGSVVGGILTDPKQVDNVLEVLSDDDFYDIRNRLIFSAAIELYKAGTAIDYLTVTENLTKSGQLEPAGGGSYIAHVTTLVPTSANVLHYAKIVREKSILRKVIDASNEAAAIAYKQELPPNEVLDRAERSILKISNRSVKQGFSKISTVLQGTFERMDEIHRTGASVRGTATGLDGLDQMLSGFNKSDLIILAARPGMGKTALALNITQNIAKQGGGVGFFSLEMSESQIADRMLSVESRVPLFNIMTGKYTEEQEKELIEAMGRLSALRIFVDDTPGLTSLEFRTKARRLVSKENISLLVIDYLQLMQGSNKDNRNQEVSEISRGLKIAAKEFNIPVLALAQLNRSVEGRTDPTPQLSDLRDSGSIEQDADIVMFIDRKAPRTGQEDRKAQLHIKKHRNGALGVVNLGYAPEFTMFYNL